MPFLDLNDDSIRHICDYLVGQHALNLSLASKRLYPLAIDRTIAALTAFRLEELRNFHWLILFGSSQSRAQFVESIVVDSAALDDYGYSASSGEENDPDLPCDAAVQLLVNLLSVACNLRRLSLDSVYITVLREPRLAEAFTALRRLTRVELGMVSDSIVKLVGNTGWDLRTLALDYAPGFHGSQNIEQDTASFAVLLDTLANFPRLHTLKIEMCFELAERHAFADLPQHSEPSFPSIRRLFFWLGPFPPAVELVRRCPNLELVNLSPDLIYRDTLELLPPAPWPPLHSLCCDLLSLHAACCATGVADLQPVTHLQVPHRFSMVDPDGEHKADVTMLLCVLGRTSPAWVQLRMELGAAPMRFWSEVPYTAPRLRCLDLTLSLADLKAEYADWLENVPGALRTLPLVYLRVQLPTMPDRHPLQDEQWEDLRDAAGEVVYNATPECAYALWAGRDAAAKGLPERCARALPTLKFFVLGDEGQPYGYNEAQEARNVVGEDVPSIGEDADVGGEDEDEDEKDDLDDLDADLNVSAMLEEPDDYSYEKRWSSDDQFGVRAWRISREGGECRLQRLTVLEHRWLRRCLDGCFDGQDVVHEPVDLCSLYDSLDTP